MALTDNLKNLVWKGGLGMGCAIWEGETGFLPFLVCGFIFLVISISQLNHGL